MFFKKKEWFVLGIILVFFPFTKINATEVQKTETKGTIGFTGVYEPIGTPDPTPPESIVWPPITEGVKPGGMLPQTNDNNSSWLQGIGTLSVSFVFLLWKRKKKHLKNENNKKAGIST
ncbi:LPXTG cell wall anchor domain-containing protein [Enterococcus innesii]|uniref:LPXTG cell wall anchor domain-containing protein n=1 Tax=Enterococcus innesii TaxID=2839759 RepID=UPI0022B9752F|nr:LPXTG cell wall anchor domain-containing protein [Enterococcus innesii]